MFTQNGYQTSRATRRGGLAIAFVLFTTQFAHAQTKTYTTVANFSENEGFPINCEGIADADDGELAIRTTAETLPYIWVACSQRGTIVRIDTQTRQVLGEYLTSPRLSPSTTCGRDPSRTTVDFDGSVWAGTESAIPMVSRTESQT